MNSYPITTNPSRTFRLHPLIAVAAGSVILVSLLGAAAITGILPNSNAKASDAAAGTAPADAAAMAAHSAAPKVASPKAVTQKTSTQVAANTAPAQPAAAPAAPAQKNSVVGIGLGALVAGALGSQMGSGDGKTLATIAGAVGGGYVEIGRAHV